jgi:CO/xanthine dehydrogenase Mo-binding subunit
MATATDVLGAPVERREDARFITGQGRFLDDIKLPGMVHLAILRSPYPHANIKSIDTAAARLQGPHHLPDHFVGSSPRMTAAPSRMEATIDW